MHPPAAPIPPTIDPDVAAAAARLRNLSEAELASLREAEGGRVVERDGRFWAETFRGFYQPVHQLAEHRYEEVRRPARACWGYRSVLVAADRGRANGSYPVHLVEGFRGYSSARWDESRRRDLRRCRSQVEIVVARDPEPFLADGWEVYASAQERIRLGRADRDAYRLDIARRVPDERRLFVAGLIDGRLAGYMESYVVDGVFYGRDLFVRTDATKSGIATGLYQRSLEIGVTSGIADRMCLGPEHTERPGLRFFKKTMGVGVVHMPIRVVIPGLIRAVMRRARPAAYYRITGDESPHAGPASTP